MTMTLRDAMTTTGSCRRFRPDPVPEELLWRLFDQARFAPSGGNRQPVRFIVVRDPAVRRRLAELYLIPWQRYLDGMRGGSIGAEVQQRVIGEADHFARHLHEVPVLVVIGVVVADLHAPDTGLGRLSFAGGASVYPAVHNLLLGCREAGLGATLTTLLAEFEPEVQELLGMPPELAVGGTVAIGWPGGRLATRLRRRPVEELVSLERFGVPFVLPEAAA